MITATIYRQETVIPNILFGNYPISLVKGKPHPIETIQMPTKDDKEWSIIMNVGLRESVLL